LRADLVEKNFAATDLSREFERAPPGGLTPSRFDTSL